MTKSMTERKEHLVQALAQNMRLDGRALDQFRDVSVQTGVSKTAEGSATVTIGDTQVIAGVKMLVGAPYPDRPDEGSIMVNSEFLPMASPDFESGPPSIDSIELARVVDRGIRESNAIDVKNLCITKGEKVWIVSIDICILNAAGNLLDACALAALAAMKDTRFPKLEDGEANYKEPTDEGIPMQKTPISVTITKIGDYLLVDPTQDEADVADARLTIAITDNGQLCALQKGGVTPVSTEEVGKMVDLALAKTQELRQHIQG